FTVDQDDPDARISWTGLHPGRYDPADVSLRPGGGMLGVGPAQRLEDSSVPVLKKGSMNLTSRARQVIGVVIGVSSFFVEKRTDTNNRTVLPGLGRGAGLRRRQSPPPPAVAGQTDGTDAQ